MLVVVEWKRRSGSLFEKHPASFANVVEINPLRNKHEMGSLRIFFAPMTLVALSVVKITLCA